VLFRDATDKCDSYVGIGVCLLVSERQIQSVNELKRLIKALDLDEGIRVVGNFKALRGGGFIFISTVHSSAPESYCANISERIYDKGAKMYLPGGKEEFRYFSDADEVFRFVEANAVKPLQAWSY
jgi:hypothetical protein